MEEATTARTVEGLTVEVQGPRHRPSTDWRDGPGFGQHYDREGYGLAVGLVPESLIDAALEHFHREVKPHRGAILRQLTTRREPHAFSPHGLMTNTILSVQDMDHPALQAFREAALAILTCDELQGVLQCLAGEPTQCVESMYFETTARGTVTHADSHFMDASKPGSMIAAWIALEDIDPRAGRLYLMPRSHRIGRDEPSLANLSSFLREYEPFAVQLAKSFQARSAMENAALRIKHGQMLKRGLEGARLISPDLLKGDVMFWSARVLHGSLSPSSPRASRNSLTAHYIARSHGYMQYGKPVRLAVRVTNGMPVHHLRQVRMTAGGNA